MPEGAADVPGRGRLSRTLGRAGMAAVSGVLDATALVGKVFEGLFCFESFRDKRNSDFSREKQLLKIFQP